ncbi:MAG: hypothetical protein ISR65_04560 [Bacteriovoracaceae bacterium]|nr:hypothetical protein [Bacteriovoracaceae bacterium]
MKIHILIFLLIISICNSIHASVVDQKIKNLQEKIEDAEYNKLPKTAIKYARQLERLALRKKLKGYYLQSVAKRILNQTHVLGKKPEDKINILNKEIKKIDKAYHPVLNSILAIWFWHYYERNRFRFSKRTKTEGLAGDDFTTWDSFKILNKISDLFESALNNRSTLILEPISRYQGLIVPGTLPPEICNTLFEFLTKEAINFYSSRVKDNIKFRSKALKLYQDLLEIYKTNENHIALVDTSLRHLEFLHKDKNKQLRDDILLKSYKKLYDSYSDIENSTYVMFKAASIYKAQKKYPQALKICNQAQIHFSSSNGAKLCLNIINSVKQKSFSLKIDHTISTSSGGFVVKYKNLEKLHFKIIKDDPMKYLTKDYGGPSNRLSVKEIKTLLAKDATSQWSTVLKPNSDYTFATKDIRVMDLPYGFYRIFASAQEDFEDRPQNHVVYASFWSTDTTMLVRNIGTDIVGLVAHSQNGHPLTKTQVSVYKRGKRGKYKFFKDLYTDVLGQFIIKKTKKDRNNYLFFAKSVYGDVLFRNSYFHGYDRNKSVRSSVQFFTDRSMYRPGQTIYFKGICYKADYTSDDYQTSNCKKVNIKLKDVNHQDIASKTLSANNLGSFSSHFILPDKVLPGNMTIFSSNPRGRVIVKVEEYKRPKFEIKIFKPSKQFRLDKTVALKGLVKSYSGVKIDDATVKFRVSRLVVLPWWKRMFQIRPVLVEIAHGVVKTNQVGEFKVKFTSTPDKTINSDLNPTFDYKVEVDVTDSTGETHSQSQTVHIGYVALKAQMTLPKLITTANRLKLSVLTTTLGNQPIGNQGTVSIYSLTYPKQVNKKLPIEEWKKRKLIVTDSYNTNSIKKGSSDLFFKLDAGAYRAVLKTEDRFGEELEEAKSFIVMTTKEDSADFSVPITSLFKVEKETVKVGDTLKAVWATGYKSAQSYISIVHDKSIVNSYWTPIGEPVHFLNIPVTPELTGGFTVEAYFIQDNVVYSHQQFISVTRSDKKLALKLTTFRDKLSPGSKETWTLTVSGIDKKSKSYELLAAMYDMSLDSFAPHSFFDLNNIFWKDRKINAFVKNHYIKNFSIYVNRDVVSRVSIERTYPSFIDDIKYGFQYLFPIQESLMMADEGMVKSNMLSVGGVGAPMSKSKGPKRVGKAKVSPPIRRNLEETAFFYPHLKSNKLGRFKFTFKTPDALTRWKLLAMAHGPQLETGLLEKEVVTQKTLMATPNPPRFLRQKDILKMPVKFSNIGNSDMKVKISFELKSAIGDRKMYNHLIVGRKKRSIVLKAGKSKTLFWEIKVANAEVPLTYKVWASSKKFKDGEEGFLPILPSIIQIKESMPLWISGKGEKKFSIKRLLETDKRLKVEPRKLTVQMTPNPAWYAAMALPYLAGSTHECTDELFNRIYANYLALHVVNSNPALEKVFNRWKKTDKVKSNLHLNEALKTVAIQETPWLLEAQNETQNKKNIAMFFNKNKINHELAQGLNELKEHMLDKGGWPWLRGGRVNHFITLYIVSGFGKLKSIGAITSLDLEFLRTSISDLDNWINSTYQKIEDKLKSANHYSSLIAFYLYGRSMLLDEFAIDPANQEAIDYFLGQSEKFWPKLGSRMSEAHTAIAASNFDKISITNSIVKSLKERALHSPELGMYWADEEYSYFWYRAPIATHALMIELFDLNKHKKEVEQLKIWLLKQKQTQGWKTNRSTAEAVYALFATGGTSLLNNSTGKTTITLGQKIIIPTKDEINLNFIQRTYRGGEITPQMGNVVLAKKAAGIAWGGVYWNYFQDIDNVTSHRGPLSVVKSLFIKRNTDNGPTLTPLSKSRPKVGDKLTVRIELKSDRDMEFIHMKDMRASGVEPVNVISSYKFQDGLSYYETTKDTATHFYFDYLPKGVYVFEYDQKIYHKGSFASGISYVQCLYAPEFSTHSKSYKLNVL